MSKIKLKDVIQHYIGCKVLVDEKIVGELRGGDFVPNSVNQIYYTIFIKEEDDLAVPYNDEDGDELRIKPYLRKLEDMSKEDAEHFAWLCMDSDYYLAEDSRVSKDEIDIDLIPNDNGLMLDINVIIYINLTCRCFVGGIAFKKDGSIILRDDNNDPHPIEKIAEKIAWLLSKKYDLFELIESKQANDLSEYEKEIVWKALNQNKRS